MPEHEPSEDQTPLRNTVPDHAWFPCPHCGRMLKCPPVAKPLSPTTTALTKRTPGRPVAPELVPDATPQDTTKVLPPEAPGT